MVKVEDAVIARLTRGEHKFEILVDPFKSQEFIEGKAKLEDVLAVNDVFKDVKSGDHVNEEIMQKTFGTTDVMKVAEQILKRGEIQLTTEQKRKMIEETRNRIINIIVRNAINPKTALPHPRTRIENALEQVRFRVDPFLTAEEQVEDILAKLRPILPIKFEKKKLAIKLPATYAVKSYSYVKSLGISKEEWTNDGSLIAVVEIPGGMQTEVIDHLNSLTKGSCEVKIM